MIIIDASGTIRFTNRQVFALFGYAHDEIIGLSIEHFMPERFRARHLGHRQQYTNNINNICVRPMGAGLQLYGRRKDGTEFPVEISLSPIEDGDQVLFAAAIRDVTDRKRVQVGKVNVLLVEDDPAVREITCMLLEARGYRATAVESLAEALRKVREESIDLLVTDYHLRDGETGTQVIAALRETLGYPLKAVLMTGDTSSAVQALPRDRHLRVVSKPIKIKELLTLLRALLAA